MATTDEDEETNNLVRDVVEGMEESIRFLFYFSL